MASELSRDEMRRLARLGAERRLEEIRREDAAIRAAFPGIASATDAAPRGRGKERAAPAPIAPQRTADSEAVGNRRRRRKMSAAEKRAVSQRMRKYWAARRKAKG